MTAIVEMGDMVEIVASCEMMAMPEEPLEEQPKRGRGRPRIEDPNHYIKYRTQYYRDNAQKWNEYQKQYIREKRKKDKIERYLKFISEQLKK